LPPPDLAHSFRKTTVTWHTLAVAVAVGLFLFDFQNVLAWWRGRILSPNAQRSTDFTIIVPVYGHPRYFDNRDSLRRYQANVIVSIDVSRLIMRVFADVLEREGWRVHRALITRPTAPGLIRDALPRVTTTYVLRMDADTRPLDEIEPFVAAMARDGAELCSTRISVADPSTEAQRFQALEYRMAMLARHFRPWLTSGACYAARTSALRTILAWHSMWPPGEDIETGRIAHAYKMRIRHLDLRVETTAPQTWPDLFNQRRLWWVGNFRHSFVNFDRNVLHFPIWSFYYVGLVWVGLYFKWHSIIGYLHPFVLVHALAWLFAVYALVTLVANWQVRSWRMIIYPPYALAQAILMPIVGSIYYWRIVRRAGTHGRYRFPRRRVALATARSA
jgi:cellulose synthase/poly-beta-1,6-N-acetylglucosamine synthase-like glycosyltransferase